MEEHLCEILKLSSLCHGLTEEQIHSLLGSSTVKWSKYKRNEILFWCDNIPENLYILVEGNIAMGKDTIAGKRSLSKSIKDMGELIGEVRLFSTKKLLWSYAIALENSTVIEIDSKVFLIKGIIDPDIQIILLRNIIGTVVDKIDNLGQKVRILSFPLARQRIAFYLFSIQDENNRIILNTTREELADYLNMARPSLSRELGRMQDEGIIKIEGHEVFILDQAIFDELFD